MGPCHHANWVEVSDPTAYRLIDPGRLRRLVNTLRDPSAQFPQILLCFGGFAKRQALGALFPSLYSLRRESPPGFANIHLDPSQAPLLHPVLLVDCTNGVPLPVRPKGRGCHEDESFDTAWVETEKQTRETVLTRLLFPFVDVVTIFADDLGGLDAAFSLLQRWSCGEPATTLSWKTRPRVCVVTSAAPTWDAHLQQRSFNSRLRAIKAGRHFSSVRLLCLPNGGGTVTWPSNGTRHLRRLLLRDELIKIRRDRQSQRAHFAAHHLAWFFTRAVAHVAKSAREPFDFICTSRVHRPLSACFPRQVSAFVRLAAENHIPCEIVVTVIASSVMLDAFPPGSHRFFPPDVFTAIYSSEIRQALEHVFVADALLAPSAEWSIGITRFTGRITGTLCEWVDGADTDGDWVVRRHVENLQATRRHVRWTAVASNACCITCLVSVPQHPLTCGHALCDGCVPRFARQQSSREYTYLLTACPLCGARVRQQVILKPPTAGVRILSVDGGGVRGVIPLQLLKTLQITLGPRQRVQDYFDIGFGTSAGGLIIAALFGMRWDISDCIERFCRSVTETLRKRPYGHVPFLSWMCDLVHSLRTGAVHSAESVAFALQECFGRDSRLFEQAGDGAPRGKFVITATTTRNASTIIFPNYNADADSPRDGGNIRTDANSPTYHRFSRGRPEDEPRIWELAAATSAAPPYFHPVSIGHLGRYQDGGMCNPNPTEIALEECAHAWPSRPRRDLIVSIGTGIVADAASPIGPSRAAFADCMPFRVARWSRSRLCKVLDPQVIHRRVKHTLYSHDRPSFDRYFRMNLDMPGPLPRMDDVTCMTPLMADAGERGSDATFVRIKLAVIASSFFFELDDMPAWVVGGRRLCVGTIRVRGDPARVLELLASDPTDLVRFTKDDEDLAVGRPSDWLCAQCGRFGRPVGFLVPSMIEPVTLSVRVGHGPEQAISGFPRELQWFVDQQRLHDPFSSAPSSASECVCRVKSKPRPLVVRKRAAPERSSGPRMKRRRVARRSS